MENMEAMKKWSALRGIAVVSVSDGKKIGSCEDFYFEPQTQLVFGLRVKTGLLSHKVVPVASINAVGQNAITIPNEDVLHSESDLEGVANLLSGEGLKNYRVMSVGGTLVGTIGNVLLDTSTPNALRVAEFELSGGIREQLSGKYPTFAASQVASFGQDVLVIPDEVAQSLH
jgi:uncharacterized protein YrrD